VKPSDELETNLDEGESRGATLFMKGMRCQMIAVYVMLAIYSLIAAIYQELKGHTGIALIWTAGMAIWIANIIVRVQ
jgi:hypothetical protein